jgi:hypothetical protein
MTAKSARERAYSPPSFRAGWRDRTDVEETARVFAALSKMTNMPAKAPTRHPMPINATLTPTTSCSVKSAHDSDGQDRGIGRYSGGEVGENNEVRARHTSVRIFIVVLPSCHGARGALLQHRGGAPFDAAPFGSGDSRTGPVAPVSACQNAANSGHSLRYAVRLSAAATRLGRQRRGAPGAGAAIGRTRLAVPGGFAGARRRKPGKFSAAPGPAVSSRQPIQPVWREVRIPASPLPKRAARSGQRMAASALTQFHLPVAGESEPAVSLAWATRIGLQKQKNGW